MSKFSVGDRVICTKAYERIPLNATGMVVQVDEDTYTELGGWIHVVWDENIGGHTCDGRCAWGYGYRTYGDNLALLVPEEEISDFDIGEFLTMVSQ